MLLSHLFKLDHLGAVASYTNLKMSDPRSQKSDERPLTDNEPHVVVLRTYSRDGSDEKINALAIHQATHADDVDCTEGISQWPAG